MTIDETIPVNNDKTTVLELDDCYDEGRDLAEAREDAEIAWQIYEAAEDVALNATFWGGVACGFSGGIACGIIAGALIPSAYELAVLYRAAVAADRRVGRRIRECTACLNKR